MELYQLRSFVVVAELAHLTRAAEKLHISQPALSAQIKALEAELDVPLFERTAAGMVVTAAGKRLLVEAEKVLNAAQALRTEARMLRGEVAGKMRIGTLYDPQFIRAGELLNLAVERYPLLEIELNQIVSGAGREQVRERTLDASYYYGELAQPEIRGLELCKFSFRVTAPAAWHDLVQIPHWSEIAAQPWIVPPPISSHHGLAHRLFHEQGVTPTKVIEADSDPMISSLVASGVGIALVREDIALEKAAAGEVCIWGKARASTTLWCVYRTDREHDPMIRALLDVLRDVWNLRHEASARAPRRSRKPGRSP